VVGLWPQDRPRTILRIPEPAWFMKYVTVFDASNSDHALPGIVVLGFVCIVCAAYFMISSFVKVPAPAMLYNTSSAIRFWFGLLLGGFAIYIMPTEREVRDIESRALRDRHYSTVAGPVTDFTRYYAGVVEKGESFVVSGKRFFISPYDDGSSFHQLSLEGGIMRDGRNVRITYFDADILRVEIAE
jgi:hypothetical protein